MSFRSFLVSRLCQYWNNPSLYGTLDGVVTRSLRQRQSKQFLTVRGEHGGTRRRSNCFHLRRGAKNTFLSAEDAEGHGEHQRRGGVSVCSWAAGRGPVALCFCKSLFGQASTGPRSVMQVEAAQTGVMARLFRVGPARPRRWTFPGRSTHLRSGRVRCRCRLPAAPAGRRCGRAGRADHEGAPAARSC